MSKVLPYLLGAVLAGGPPAWPQTLQEAFRCLPDQVTDVECFPNLARANPRMDILSQRVARVPSLDLAASLTAMKLPARDLAPGPVLMGEFKSSNKGFCGVYVVPVKRFATLVRDMKAVKDGPLYRAGTGANTVYLANRGTFLLAARDKALLAAFPREKALDREMGYLAPWIATQATAIVFTQKTVQAGLAKLEKRMGKEKTAQQKAMAELFRPLVQAVAASGRHFAIGLELREDGAALAHAKLFLKPGSPAASFLAGGGTGEAIHPMAGLPHEGLVLGYGGSLSAEVMQAFGDMVSRATPAAMPGLSDEDAAKAAAQAKETVASMRGTAFFLGLPARPGDPLLSRMRGITRVVDAKASLERIVASAQTGAMPWLTRTTSRVDLDGAPGVSQVFVLDSTKLPQGFTLPPMQVNLITSLLFGTPGRSEMTVGLVDDHTLLTVLGGADAFRQARKESGSPFAQDLGIAAADQLLPATAGWRFYLDLKGVRDLAQVVVDGLVPAQRRPSLPEIPAAPPLVTALEFTPTAIGVTAAASVGTLDALGAFVQGIKSLIPQPKSAAKP